MSFPEFIRRCESSEKVSITQVLCVSSEGVLAKYVKYPYRMDTLKLFYSMTKTITSLAVGIAADKGLISIDDPIVRFFGGELPAESDENLSKITVRHLLTMSCGLHEDTYPELFVQADWVKAFLAQTFPHEPGTHFRYCTHGTHMLSAIMTKASGKSLEDFVNEHLFYPMGITEAVWEHAPEGLVAGGMGLSIYPLSLAKIAQLLLGGGVYGGRRLVSAEYIAEASKAHITKQDEDPAANEFGGVGYGFQLHVGKDGYYRLDGSFGQMCLICPDRDLAVIAFSQNTNMEALLALTYTHLLDGGGIAGDIGHDGLCVYESSPCELPCGAYTLESNDQGIERIELGRTDTGYRLTLCFGDRKDEIGFAPGRDTSGRMYFVKDLEDHLQEYVCHAEYAAGALCLRLWFIETPYVADYRISFNDAGIEFSFAVNVSFTLRDFAVKGLLC